jgi:acylphosphatase
MERDIGNMIAARVRVSGRVQGVGFRYSTQREAKRRGITGWVRNEYDGSVQVECEGEEADVKQFVGWLKKGPPGAHVTHADVKKLPYKGVYSSFTVEF